MSENQRQAALCKDSSDAIADFTRAVQVTAYGAAICIIEKLRFDYSDDEIRAIVTLHRQDDEVDGYHSRVLIESEIIEHLED